MFAAFGMGCFWHSEEVFKRLKGVNKTTVGYMGGRLKNPTYEEVCGGKTGHTEVVQLDYNPKLIKYNELLEVFFKSHNPSQLNKQGPDVGYQYRSVIFYYSDSQRIAAMKMIKELKKSKEVVTALEPAKTFYPAEEYHQDYYDKHKLTKLIKEGSL